MDSVKNPSKLLLYTCSRKDFQFHLHPTWGSNISVKDLITCRGKELFSINNLVFSWTFAAWHLVKATHIYALKNISADSWPLVFPLMFQSPCLASTKCMRSKAPAFLACLPISLRSNFQLRHCYSCRNLLLFAFSQVETFNITKNLYLFLAFFTWRCWFADKTLIHWPVPCVQECKQVND